MARPWATALRHASELEDRLDRAVGSVDLGVGRIPAWTRLVRGIQWLLLLGAVTGAVWLGALAVLSYLRLSEPATPDVGALPLPTLLLVGGVALGLLLATTCRLRVRRTARKRAGRAERRLRAAVDEVTDELVVAPVVAELDAYRTTTEGLRAAGG